MDDRYEFRVTEGRFKEALLIVTLGSAISPKEDEMGEVMKMFVDLLFVATYCTYDKVIGDFVHPHLFTEEMQNLGMDGMLEYATAFVAEANKMLGIEGDPEQDPRLIPFKRFLGDRL